VTALRIEPVDGTTADEAVLRAIHLVETEADERGPSISERPVEEALASYRHPGDAVRKRWLATVADEPAGAGFLTEYSGSFAVGYVLVRPAFRRRGVGRALLDEVAAEARRDGMRSFFGEFVGDAGRAFAHSVGALEDQRHVLSVLDLSGAELPPPADVELRSWVGACPADLVDAFVRARAGIADAPVPGGQTMPPWTVERQRRDEERWLRRGYTLLTTIAVERDDVLALTGVRIPPAPAREAQTDDTTTVPAARGRGLARAVKLENLRRLRELRPDVERVVTRNAAQNAAILAVNAGLGFVPERTVTTAVLSVAPAHAGRGLETAGKGR
jgi:GNAT superfamily N-acetyltransferase